MLTSAASAPTAYAQIDLTRIFSGLTKTVQAISITDDQIAQAVHQSVAQMDSQNTVLPEDSPYTMRLRRLTQGITQVNGIPLNFKVYKTSDVNAFACPDGSVRVFSGLMDIMDDDELLGIIGHEIGHVMKHHSRNAIKNQLLTSAAKDALASTSGSIAMLTDSQLGAIGEALIDANYSQKQETEADDCGYDFLVANHRNPWGLVESFQKLQTIEAREGGSGDGLQKMFSDHPDTQKRIDHISERCMRDGYSPEGDAKATQPTSISKPVAPATQSTSSMSDAEKMYQSVKNRATKTIHIR